MNAEISKNNLQEFQKKFNKETALKISQNALTHNEISKVALNWDAFRKINHVFSHKIKNEMKKVTNQKASGRCWGFAGLNLMRIALCEKYKIENFEFSQNYFMFCDKLEKSNYFLENIIKTKEESCDSRIMMWLLSEPLNDGGQWDMFVNLIEKYGLLPKSVMPESYQSSSSRMMNRLITRKLREYAIKLRDMYKKGKKTNTIRQEKAKMMKTIYNMLCVCLGTPPEKFTWQIRNKKNKFIRFEKLTPLTFYKQKVKYDLKNKVCLIHCPMSNKKFNEHYTVKFLGNVVGGKAISYANVNIDIMKKATIKSLKNNEAVWFGCDVSKMFNYEKGVMDMNLYDYDLLFGTTFNLSKKNKLEYGDSVMTHAMLITAVDIVNNKPQKWRIENSWGEKNGDKGYLLMTDNWFDEYTYEIIVDKKFLSKETVEIFNKKAINLDPWDPMGSLAK